MLRELPHVVLEIKAPKIPMHFLDASLQLPTDVKQVIGLTGILFLIGTTLFLAQKAININNKIPVKTSDKERVRVRK